MNRRLKKARRTLMAAYGRKPMRVVGLLSRSAASIRRTRAVVDEYIRFDGGLPRGEAFLTIGLADDYGPGNMVFLLKEPELTITVKPSFRRLFRLEIEGCWDRETRGMYGEMFGEMLSREITDE